jgi:hypothetical protein
MLEKLASNRRLILGERETFGKAASDRDCAGALADAYARVAGASGAGRRGHEGAQVKPAVGTLFTPHRGSAVAAARLEIERSAANSIVEALQSQPPQARSTHPRNGTS